MSRRLHPLLTLVFALAAAVLPRAPVAAQAAYRVVEVGHGGILSGVIRFGDEFPPAEKIRVTKDNDICGLSKPSEDFVVDEETKGLANAVVRVEGVAAGKGFGAWPAPAIRQAKCAYSPHVQVFRPGDKVTFTTGDNLLHNVHTYLGDETLFNVAQPPSKPTIVRPLTGSEVVEVTCDVHEWMTAWLVPVATPYFAISDRQGRFRIDDIPPGTYTVSAWHEVLGVMERRETFSAGATTEVVFEILPEE